MPAGYDIYLGQNRAITTRDRLSDPNEAPLFPRPGVLPSQSQALTTRREPSRRSPTRRSSGAYGILPSMSTSAPAQLEERSPRRSNRHEVPPPRVIQAPAASNRYEVPPPPLLPAYQPSARFVLPAPIDPPTVAQPEYHDLPPPVPEVPAGQHRRHYSNPTSEPRPMTPLPGRSLRVDIPQHQGRGHRRAPSSTSSLSPGALSPPRSGRSTASHSGRSSGGGTPDTSRSRGSKGSRRSRRREGQRLLEDPRSGSRPWTEEVVFRDEQGRQVRQYRYD